jgi:membrane protein YdbS with pleckstrin-like domain
VASTVRPPPERSVDPRAITLWRLEAGLSTGLFALFLLAGLGSLLVIAPPSLALMASAFVLLVAYAGVQIGLIPKLRYRYFRYQLDEHELDIQKGVFVVRRTLVPLVRVQHVDTVQGPLSKQLGLTSVTVSTAAGAQVIPALSEQSADELRNQISALARVAREQF